MGEPERVHAFIGSTVDHNNEWMDAQSQISFQFPKNRIGNLEIVYSPKLKISGKYYAQDDRVEITGTEGVLWINDSKGTNPGAAEAALVGLDRPVVLIAGGQSKGADFRALAEAIQRYARQVLLIGEDRVALAEAIGDRVPVTLADDLPQAVRLAARWAQSGDAVLFSPACASFDMFRDFAHRGEVFSDLVREMIR